jgi:hypothetical protein
VPANIARILNSADGKRRILIVERADGNFGFVEQYWYRTMYEGKLVSEGWAVLDTPPSIFKTVEIAEREARVYYPWLAASQSGT